MKQFLTAVVMGLISASSSGAMSPQEEIEAKVPAARALLEGWEKEAPEKGERKLHIVYWTPNDREPAPNYRERLTAILEDIRDFYAAEMTRIGFGPRTIGLDYSDDGQLQIHLVKGRKNYAAYSVDSGGEIRNECQPTLRKAGLDPGRETVVIFCNMSNWNPSTSRINQNSPYYAGGSHRNGTAWLVDSPILDLESLTKKEPLVDDGQHGKISIGRYNTIFIGGVCHELGHALGLPHNKERSAEQKVSGTALMGSGNSSYGEERRNEGRGAFLTLAHAMKLASHPMFSGSVKRMDQGSNAKIDGLTVEAGERSFKVRGKVTADPVPYVVIGYMDPEGGKDYDATSCTAVPDEEGNFVLDANGLVPGENQEFRLVVCQVNGAASTYVGSNSRWKVAYRVDKEGKVDLSLHEASSLLKVLVERVNARDKEGAKKELERLEKTAIAPLLLEIGEALISTLNPGELPQLADLDVQNISLSEVQPVEAKVGWGKLMVDRVPDASALIRAGGKLFSRGIYAHAPAMHRWDLDGKWKTLKGEAGLASVNSRGSCVFVVVADGREVWRSKRLSGNHTQRYSIDLSGVKSLELRVEDAGDGKGSDWGFWLNPELGR